MHVRRTKKTTRRRKEEQEEEKEEGKRWRAKKLIQCRPGLHAKLKTKWTFNLKTDLDASFDSNCVLSSSLNSSATDLCTSGILGACESDKFSLALDASFNEMEASRGSSTPDTLDGFQ